MDPITMSVATKGAAVVLEEAFDELTGRSNRKWAVVLVSFVLGALVAMFVAKRRREQLASADQQE